MSGFVKCSQYVGLFGSVGLMLSPALPVSLIGLSGAMVMFGFAVDRISREEDDDERTD